jgi:DNA adenine methylase
MMKPLYMWAGGKNKMIPKYQTNPGIPMSGYDTYVEPFFGGGAMMIHVYQNNPTVKNFVLNDINPEIVGLYHAIKNHVAEFIRIVDSYADPYLKMDHAARKAFYYATRKQYATAYQGWGSTEESAVLYFLMKTAFNGIWQTTQEAKGRFCTPSGLLNHKDTVYDKDNVMDWNRFLQRVTIHSGDWKQCCEQVSGRAFYFFDPPYRDSFTQYGTVFDDQAHVDLIDFCKTQDLSGHLVMYCNRKAGDTDTFYTANQGHLLLNEYDIKYTAGRRATEKNENDQTVRTAKAAREILLYSPAITSLDCQILPTIDANKTIKKKSKTTNNFDQLMETVDG